MRLERLRLQPLQNIRSIGAKIDTAQEWKYGTHRVIKTAKASTDI